MTLEMFPVTTAAPATASSVPACDEVEEFMKSLLPSPSDVFTQSFFRSPLFAIVSLHEVAKIYGCPAPQVLMTEALGLPIEDMSNKNIQVHVWFADFLNCNREAILAVVDSFKNHRGSANMIRRLLLSGNRSDSPTDKRLLPTPTAVADPIRPSGNPRTEDDYPTSLNAPSNRPVEDTRRDVRLDRPITESSLADQSNSRKATNVFQYFKDNKFTGDISQSIELVIRDYNVCARQHRLNPNKADFFVNVLADPARTFFFNNARDDMSFDDMARMMVNEYNSDARQLQVQGTLETLRLDKYMAEHELTNHSEGLTKLVDLTERLTPQCQPQFRSDANKVNYMRKAVLGFSWSMAPIGNIITAKYSFNGFVTALREHLQLQSEVSQASPTMLGPHRTPPDNTFHQQYGRNPKHVRKHDPSVNHSKTPSKSSSSFEESRRKGICHMCKQKWSRP